MGNCCKTPSSEYDFEQKKGDISQIKMSKEINRILDIMEYKHNVKGTPGYIRKKNFEDDYKVLNMLGSGLFSKVYLVSDKKNKLFAMKVIEKSNFKAREHIQKILIEKEIMKNVKHRNVLKLYKTFQTRDNVYFILEYAAKGRPSYVVVSTI
jgi:serine/threonine protein kinase